MARPNYNKDSVQKEIDRNKRIGKREAELIHTLLKGTGVRLDRARRYAQPGPPQAVDLQCEIDRPAAKEGKEVKSGIRPSQKDKEPSTMKLEEYLAGMEAAQTCEELEAAIHMPFRHTYRGRTWNRICKVRIVAGERIVAANPNGRFVPHFGAGRRLTVCGESYRVGRGGNSTGVRYSWHHAGEWAMAILRREGFSIRAAHRIWDGWDQYPHRCLATVAKALAGGYPDPELNLLVRHERTGYGHPIKYTVEQNEADPWDRRASRPCACGGTLFDWGAGHSDGFDYINWHCNACPDVFTEYMTQKQLYALRQSGRQQADCPES